MIVEAGAARLPIVSTRHAGIPEQIDDGSTGLLAPERDIAALADALASLTDPARRNTMGDAARAKMERDYSLAAHCARLHDIYAILSYEHARRHPVWRPRDAHPRGRGTQAEADDRDRRTAACCGTS